MSVIGHVGVPLFLMISGALLLKKSLDSWQDVKKFYRNNMLPMFITSEIWYFIMYWFILFVSPENNMLETKGIIGSIPQLLQTMVLYKPTTMRSMWYIPVILRLYAAIPIFAIAIKHADSKKLLLLPCFILFLSNMLRPDIKDIVGLITDQTFSRPKSDAMYLLYIFAGYAISRGAMKKLSTRTVFLGVFGFFLVLWIHQLGALALDYNYCIDYDTTVLLFWGCFVFEAIRRKGDLLKFAKKSITHLSKVSFGIYFIHIILMEAMDWTLSFTGFLRPAKFVVLEVVSFGGSLLLIWLLSKNKYLKRYMLMLKS